MVLALLFIFLVRPVFESGVSIRFLADQSPLGGALGSAAGQGSGGLSLLASIAGRAVPTQTEVEVLRSRGLAGVVMKELGLRLELRKPSRVRRGAVFQEVTIFDDAVEGNFTLERVADGEFSVTARIVVDRNVFRPILNESKTEVALGSARVGEPLPIGGARIVLAPEAATLRRIRFRIHPMQDALDDFQKRISIDRPRRDADVVRIHVRWSDPEVAAHAADRMAVRFMERREAFLSREFGRTATFLSSELDSLQGELIVAEEALRVYREAEGIVEPEVQATVAVEQLADLQGRRDLIASERQALLTLLDEVRAIPVDVAEESPYRQLVYFPTLLATTATAELLRLLGELENQRAALLDRRTPDAREIRVLSERVTELEHQLRTVAETFMNGLGNQVESMDKLISGFRDILERVPAVELQYLRRQRQVEVLTEVYLFMQLRQKEAEITAAGESGGVRIMDASEVPIEPVVPQPLLTLIISLIVGVGIGVGGAAALEHAGSVVGEVPPEIAA
jgi:uncharacterized protein involved in exopolysaccharide biosynthesis